MKTLILTLIALVTIWVAYRYFLSRVKEPKFIVIEKKDNYETREYAPYIEARVQVSGEYREAMTLGFRILAGYIFGGNTKKQSIAMTAPVSEMVVTANARVVSFVMPDEYISGTLPTPNDTRIEIVEVPAHRSAVLRYSGHNNSEKVAQMKAKLLEYLKRDNVDVVGVPRGAGYNPPWTPPFMNRNEILVDITQ